MEGITYELKYCERCGTLGLRRSKSTETYCRPCGQVLVNSSLPTGAVRSLRIRKPAAEPPAPFILKAAAAATVSGVRL
ncbi:MAG: hypothetical protein WCC87_02315 [Candidatus Korobacteraceae bacterium]